MLRILPAEHAPLLIRRIDGGNEMIEIIKRRSSIYNENRFYLRVNNFDTIIFTAFELQLSLDEYMELLLAHEASPSSDIYSCFYFKTREQAQRFIDEVIEPICILNKITE